MNCLSEKGKVKNMKFIVMKNCKEHTVNSIAELKGYICSDIITCADIDDSFKSVRIPNVGTVSVGEIMKKAYPEQYDSYCADFLEKEATKIVRICAEMMPKEWISTYCAVIRRIE